METTISITNRESFYASCPYAKESLWTKEEQLHDEEIARQLNEMAIFKIIFNVPYVPKKGFNINFTDFNSIYHFNEDQLRFLSDLFFEVCDFDMYPDRLMLIVKEIE